MTKDQQVEIIQKVLFPNGKTIWDELNETSKRLSRVFSWDPQDANDE